MALEPEQITTNPDDIPWATDGMSAPTYYVEHIRGTMVSRGVVKLNMIENRLDAVEGGVRAAHVVTIITPIDQLRAWSRYLSEVADQNGVPTEAEVAAQAAAAAAAANGG